MSMKERDAFEARARSGSRWVPGLDEHSALCRVLDSFWLYVDTRDTSLTPHLLTDGYWEPWVTIAIAKHVKPGMDCVDIGANVGYFTLLMAQLAGEKGYVTAYEPQQRIAGLLEASAKINGFKNVFVSGYALGAKNEWRDLVSYGSEYGSASISAQRTNDAPGVEVMTLDEQEGWSDVTESNDVAFIKIDAEGSEPAIWDGMQRVLREHKPTVTLEFIRDFYDDPGVLLRKIQESGYRLGVIETDGSLAPSSENELLGGDHGDKEMLWLVPKA
jgi:FkbM family methyltransferase